MHAYQQDTHSFELTDRWGEKHYYSVTLHGARHGTKVMMELLGLLGPSLGAALKTIFSGRGGKLADMLDAETSTFTDGIDFEQIGTSLQAALMDENSAELVDKILRNTTRDAVPLEKGYDEAYRGNYAESGRAVWEVVRINGFFPLLDTFNKLSKKEAQKKVVAEA